MWWAGVEDIMMDHPLRTISYIADIGDIVVLMARRVSQVPPFPLLYIPCPIPCSGQASSPSETDEFGVKAPPKIICHVFESEEAGFIAQSIGQAFQVAYLEFLRANGIEDPRQAAAFDYEEVPKPFPLPRLTAHADDSGPQLSRDLRRRAGDVRPKGEPEGRSIPLTPWYLAR